MKRYALCLAAAAAIVLAGCVRKVEPRPPGTGPSPAVHGMPALPAAESGETRKASTQYRVGVTLLNRVHAFYVTLEKSMVAEAKAVGIELVVQSGDEDALQQKNQIEDFVQQKMDAIIVCPVDSASVGGAVKHANEAGVPVFTADIGAAEGEVVAHIATDNVDGGRRAGQFLAQAIGGKGKVIILDRPDVTSVQDRVKGFLDVMKDNPRIEVVDKPDAKGNREEALARMQDMLIRHPDMTGVFCINDDTALGALAAVEASANAPNDLVMVGYDATDEAREKIKAGTCLKADVVQYPDKIGAVTIRTVVDYLDGRLKWKSGDPTKVIPIQAGILTRDDLMKAGDAPLEGR